MAGVLLTEDFGVEAVGAGGVVAVAVVGGGVAGVESVTGISTGGAVEAEFEVSPFDDVVRFRRGSATLLLLRSGESRSKKRSSESIKATHTNGR